jgi:hypothetical protein
MSSFLGGGDIEVNMGSAAAVINARGAKEENPA